MTEGMMDSSYGPSPPVKAPAEKAPEQSVDEQNAGAAEILIAKDKLPPGTKEGATCTFKVVQSTGDEFILEHVKDGEGNTSETSNENPEETTDRELTALDSQNT
jgi:hypothetical protein